MNFLAGKVAWVWGGARRGTPEPAFLCAVSEFEKKAANTRRSTQSIFTNFHLRTGFEKRVSRLLREKEGGSPVETITASKRKKKKQKRSKRERWGNNQGKKELESDAVICLSVHKKKGRSNKKGRESSGEHGVVKWGGASLVAREEGGTQLRKGKRGMDRGERSIRQSPPSHDQAEKNGNVHQSRDSSGRGRTSRSS